MHLQESGEMYLETIYILSKSSDVVRSLDVAEYRGFPKPSVRRAVGLLRQEGYSQMGKNRCLSLTDSGREIAEKIYERHALLTKLLVHRGEDEAIVAKDAGKIEHDIREKSFEAMKRYAAGHGGRPQL